MASKHDVHPYWVNMDQLAVLFPAFKGKAGISVAIHRGTFPIHTFRLGGKRYADKEVVRDYFRKVRAEAKAAQLRAERQQEKLSQSQTPSEDPSQ
jgi:hypothetical protein